MQHKTALQKLVSEAVDRQEAEAKREGKRWFVKDLERDFGIANGTIGDIIKGKRGSVNAKNAPKLAAALGVPLAVYLDAQSQSAASKEQGAEGQEEAPVPPSSRRPIMAETIVEVFERAFDGTRHNIKDYEAVKQLLREHPLLAGEADPVILVTAWLDSAARIRGRGAVANAQAILADLAIRVATHEPPRPRPKSA